MINFNDDLIELKDLGFHCNIQDLGGDTLCATIYLHGDIVTTLVKPYYSDSWSYPHLRKVVTLDDFKRYLMLKDL